MNRPTTTVGLVFAVTFLAGIQLLAAEPPAAITGECRDYFGPNGAYADTGGVKLLDKIKHAKLLWKSEENNIGFGKAFSAAAGSGFGGGLPPSGASQPILAGGTLVQFYSLPRGPETAKLIEQYLGERLPMYKSFTYINADDVLIGIDARTGKTRWKTVFEGKGVNRVPGKRGEFAVAPCTADGRVFAFGTTGRIYAVELATGKILWETNIGPMHEQQEKIKLAAMKEGKPFGQIVIDGKRIGDVRAPCGGLVEWDGVLLAPDWNGGLLGLSVKDGSKLWSVAEAGGILSPYNLPVPVKVDDKNYIATINATGDLRLIDHRTGTVLWKHAVGSQHYLSPVFGKELLLVMDPAGKKTETQQYGVLAGYRLTTAGAERVWKLDETKYQVPMWLDAGPSRKFTTRRDGTIYYAAWNFNNDPGSLEVRGKNSELLAVNEADGKIIAEVPSVGHYWCIYLWGDKLFFLTDIQHGEHSQWRIYDPATLKLLDEDFFPAAGSKIAKTLLRVGGYEQPLFEIYADGLMYIREVRPPEQWGGVTCYDLRAENTEKK